MSSHVGAGRMPVWAMGLVAGGFAAESVSAAEWDIPGDFPTIQSAIDFAADGDTLRVAPGVYFEQINFLGKKIVLIGTEGASETVIDGGGAAGSVVRATGGETSKTRLQGFTIRGGESGLFAQGASPTIESCIFTGNHAGTANGGGMRILSGSPTIVSSRFTDNSAFFGGGVYAESSTALFVSCDFVGNTAQYGGGVALVAGAVRLEDATIDGNQANSLGAGVYVNTGASRIEGSRVRSNSLALGGGGIYASGSSLRVVSTRISNNSAFAGAGLYFASGNAVQVLNCLVNGNGDSVYGAIYLNGASPTITNCTIAGNLYGGIFTTYGSFPKVRNSIVAENGDDLWVGTNVYGNGASALSHVLIGGPLLAGFSIDGPVLADADPLFADADFRIAPGSPAIDAGDNALVPVWIKNDIDGLPRFLDDPDTPDTGIGEPPIVDLGAYELQPAARPLRKEGHSLGSGTVK